jgi:hypothetical protein
MPRKSILALSLLVLLSCRTSDMPSGEPADATTPGSGGRLDAAGAIASGGATGGGASSATGGSGSGGQGAIGAASADGPADPGSLADADARDADTDVDVDVDVRMASASDAGSAGDTPSLTDADDSKPTGNPCPGYKKGTHAQAGVTVAAFCVAYLQTCPSSGERRLRDLADCQTSYGAADGPGQTCLAGHLCEAIGSTGVAGKNLNCDAAGHGRVCR